MEREQVLSGLIEERARLISLLEGLGAETWEHRSACEGWSIRDVVVHLVGNADDVVNGRLEDFGSEAFNQRQQQQRAGTDPATLLAELADLGAQADAVYAALDADTWATHLDQIKMTIGWGVQRMLEDLWVHAQDIRVPLGMDPVPGPGLTASLEVVAHDVATRCAAFAPSVGALEFDVDGFKSRVDLAGSTTVRLGGDPITVALVGTGRIEPARAIADGAISVEPMVEGFDAALNIYGTPVPA